MLAILLISLLQGGSVYGSEESFEILRADRESARLKLLKIDELASRIRSGKNEAGQTIPVLELRGSIPKDASLVVDDVPAALPEIPEGSAEPQEIPFEIKVPLSGEETKTRWLVVDPYGKARTETLRISFPDYADYVESGNRRFFDRFRTLPSLSFTSTSYKQTPVSSVAQPGADVSQLALTGKLYTSYNLGKAPNPGLFQLGGGAFFTLLPFNVSPTQDFSMRFLGVNLRAGYLRTLPGGWEIALHGGFYYLTMFTSGAFGVVNLAGPQLYPTVKKELGPTDSLQGYFKLSPISDGFGIQSLSNRELAFGLGWTHLISNGHPLVVSLDVATIEMTYLRKFDVSTASYSLGFGYGL